MEKENQKLQEMDNEETPFAVNEEDIPEELPKDNETPEENAPEAEKTAETETATPEPDINSEEYTYVSRKERKNVGKKRKKGESAKKGFNPFKIIIPVVILALLIGGFLSLPQFLSKGVIPNNVWSASIELSGLTAEEAEEKLADAYTPKLAKFSVVFNYTEGEEEKQKSATFTSEDINFTLDPQKTAQEALTFGRSGNILENSWNALRSMITSVDIGMVPACNEDALSAILYELGASVNGESEAAKFIIENNTLTISPATPGQSHNVSLAVNEFLKSTQKGIYTDIPVTLKTNADDKLNADEIYEKLSAEPKDAEYKIENNTVTITDHVVGVTIDKAKLSALVDQANQGLTGSIDVIETMPNVTKEALQQSLFGTTLATYSSNYKTSTENRCHNIQLASSKVNGMILADGAEFSYNGVIGNPNAANGYKMATVFADGKSTAGVGGGVCQVSSTIYCAVLRSDLAVLERRNHSLPVGYVPGGQDATVAYGVIDFRFKNNTGAPIKLVVENSNKTLTVSILGSAAAKKKVDVSSERVATIAPTMTEVKDPTLPAGTRKVISSGKAGSTYVTYKRVYDANGVLVSENKTRSTYKATPGEVAIGTGAAPSAPASTTTPNPASEKPNTEKPEEEKPAAKPAEENNTATDSKPAENNTPTEIPDEA